MVFRSMHHLKTLFKRLDTSEEELKSKVPSIKDKLYKLREKSDKVIDYLQESIEATSREVTLSFREHLKTPVARNQITQWLINELVPASEFNGWAAIKSYLDDSIKSRVGKILKEWNQENHVLEKLENDIAIETRNKLHLLEDEIDKVENDLQDNVSVSSDDDVMMNNDMRRLTLTGQNIKFNQHRLLPENASRLPLQLMVKILGPFKEVQNKVRLKEYISDPVAVMKDRSERHWRNLIKSENEDLVRFISGLMERPIGYLNLIRNSIPKIIGVNEELIEQIKFSRQQKIECREDYEFMSATIETLKKVLSEFGNGYVFVNDFADMDIRLKADFSQSGGRSTFKVTEFLMNSGSFTEATKSKHPMGLWTVHQNGFSTKEGLEENITIKLYLKSSNFSNCFQEVAKLR